MNIGKYLYIFSAFAALTLTACKQDNPIEPEKPDDPTPVTPEVPDGPGIRDAAEFMEFAAAVNAGEATTKWESEEGWVNLLADIDFSGIENFEPVGHVTAPWVSNVPEVKDGHPFTGKFDGNAHHIKNLKLTCAETVAGKHFGIFGFLGKGAVVQNFVIDESCSLTVTTGVSLSAGVVAGVLYDATVRDVTSRAPMTYKGSTTGYLHMALIGGIFAKEEGCTVVGVNNYGNMTVMNTANLNSGATGIHCAGIVGFANAPTGNAKRNRIAECKNYGEMNSQAARQAGIVAAANACTDIVDCENRGNQMNTMPKSDGGRLGNICCFTTNGSSITGCKNYGNLVSTTSGRVGGIVSLPNAGTYDNNENYGEIISDSEYRGALFGYVTEAAAWKGGKASGKVGRYNSGTYKYDAYSTADEIKYLGKDGSSGKATYTGVVIDMDASEGPEGDADIDVTASFRILFLGSSFTKDAVEHLPKIIAAAGLRDVQLVHMFSEERTLPEYNDGWSSATDYKCYVCNPGENGWKELSGKTLEKVAASGRWDVVTLQEHTGKQAAWEWTATEKTAVQDLAGKVKAAQAASGGNPYLYYILSQAYQDVSKASGTKPFSTTAQMWTVIAAQAKKAVEECGFDGVISTGAMLQNLRTSGLNNSLGLTRDGYHMDYGIARYGASCTVFETIIGPLNGGMTLDNNSFRTSGDSNGTTAITDRRAPVALKAARYAIAKPYEVTDMTGEGEGDDPDVPAGPDNLTISTAAELTAFATRVNKGEEAAVKATVTLAADIDLGGVEWTPIGNGTATSANSDTPVSGNVFSGSFDGNGHKVDNFKVTQLNGKNGTVAGLFGIVQNATVKNLVIGDKVNLTVNASSSATYMAMGGAVGFSLDSVLEDIDSYATLYADGGLDKLRVCMGGVVGTVFSVSAVSTARNLSGHASITSKNTVNTNNGAANFQIGGVVGFTQGRKTDLLTLLERCVNYSDITAEATRLAGVVGTMNGYTQTIDCTNNGKIVCTDTKATNSRPAGIVSAMGDYTYLTRDVNNGDIAFAISGNQNQGYAAGIVGQTNDSKSSSVIDACASYGTVQSDMWFGKTEDDHVGEKYMGIVCADFNSKTITVKNCIIGGKIGPYTVSAENPLVTLTADNFSQYYTLEPESRRANVTFTGNKFGVKP